ncbi:MAG: type IV pilin protein [Gammaproteobacteria bacterium]
MSRARGFTLIEVMVTVAIVAILASIAIPTYQDQVRKARRSDGQSLLLDIAQQQERFLTANSTYTQNMNDLGYAGSSSSQNSDEGNYSASISFPNGCAIAECYRLLATPIKNAQLEDGSLVLWSNGRLQRSTEAGGWKEGWE